MRKKNEKIENVVCIKDFSFSNDYNMLEIFCKEVLVIQMMIPLLGNIKQLVLSMTELLMEDNLLWVSSILDASPCLQKLLVLVMISWYNQSFPILTFNILIIFHSIM